MVKVGGLWIWENICGQVSCVQGKLYNILCFDIESFGVGDLFSTAKRKKASRYLNSEIMFILFVPFNCIIVDTRTVTITYYTGGINNFIEFQT